MASIRPSGVAVEVVPIGSVRSTRSEVVDDRWDAETASIDLDPAQFSADALAGLDAFSHVEILFLMDRVPSEKIVYGARHPRNDPTLPKVGVFAQRGKNRPNRIGLTICEVVKIEGLTLHLRGLDAVAGTPVLDIKPWFRAFGPRGEVREASWASSLMERYWA